MDPIKLEAEKRTVTGKQVSQVRRAGKLPAILYGRNVQPVAIQLDAREAARALRRASGADLIDLTLDGETRKVLLQDLQRDSLRGDFLHADFYAVDMNRALRAQVPVHLVGTSYAVISLQGVLVRGVTTIEVECLPNDLVASLDVDLGALNTIGSAIYVRDVYVPKSIKVLTDGDELVARATAAREEELAVPAAPTAAEVEVIEKGKAEEGEEEAE